MGLAALAAWWLRDWVGWRIGRCPAGSLGWLLSLSPLSASSLEHTLTAYAATVAPSSMTATMSVTTRAGPLATPWSCPC